jgi:class 3 adenylate cyclase
LATVLFTDIVDSTAHAVALGDERWRAVLDDYEGVVRRVVEAFGGEIIKSTGDGVLAILDGPARAVRCGFELRTAAVGRGLELRVGVHTGEIERRRDDDVAGLAVHIAARILELANGGEVLVSRTVKDLVAASELSVGDRGTHILKGVPDDWQVFCALP